MIIPKSISGTRIENKFANEIIERLSLPPSKRLAIEPKHSDDSKEKGHGGVQSTGYMVDPLGLIGGSRNSGHEDIDNNNPERPGTSNAKLDNEVMLESSELDTARSNKKQVNISGVFTRIQFIRKRKPMKRMLAWGNCPTYNRTRKDWYNHPSQFVGCPNPNGTSQQNLIKRVISILNDEDILNFCVEFLPDKGENSTAFFCNRESEELIRWVPYTTMKKLQPKDRLEEFINAHYLPQGLIFDLLFHEFEVEGSLILGVQPTGLSMEIK